MDIKEKIKSIKNQRKSKYTQDEIKEVFYLTKFLDDFYPRFVERLYCIVNEVKERPVCERCGHPVKFYSGNKGYSKYCSRYCSSNCKNKKERQKNTMIDKYGVSHTSKLKENREKMKETNIKKYGVDSPLKLKKIKDKMKKTVQEKYDVDYVMQNKEFVEKMMKTNIERFGEFNLRKKSVLDKVEKRKRKNNWEGVKKTLEAKNIQPLFSNEEYINFDLDEIKQYRCEICGNIIKTKKLSPQKIYCNKHPYRSNKEHEIFEYIDGLIDDKIVCSKKVKNDFDEFSQRNYEIDVFVPERKFGVEYHGLYWHNDLRKEKKYHREKWEFFSSLGLNVLQVFESEWQLKKDIVKSIIKTNLGLNDRIYGRKCEICSLDSETARRFCENNHIQGYRNSSVKIGLFYDENLVSVMTFGKYVPGDDADYELIRFCNKKGVSVIGGMSKLFSYFIKHHDFNSIISFCDVRFFNGSGYEKCGFEYKELTAPNYFYFKDGDCSLLSRMNFQKHKLKNVLESFNPKMTEYENMLENGYYRIYDAGHKKFLFYDK